LQVRFGEQFIFTHGLLTEPGALPENLLMRRRN